MESFVDGLYSDLNVGLWFDCLKLIYIYLPILQGIKIEQNLGESFELKSVTCVDTDQSSDNGKSEPD